MKNCYSVETIVPVVNVVMAWSITGGVGWEGVGEGNNCFHP